MKNLTFFVPSHTDFYKCMEIKEKVVISSDLSNLAGAADCKSLGRFIRRFAWTAFGVVRWRSPNQLFRWAEPNTPLANKKPPKRAAFYWLGRLDSNQRNGGIRIRCLTTWRRPNNTGYYIKLNLKLQVPK